MRKKILLAAAVVICLAIAAIGTLAFFTAKDTAYNEITAGGVSVELVEKTLNADGVLVDFPEEGITGIMPGTDVSKIVSVKNTGTGTAWIRVQVKPSITSAEGSALPVEIEGVGPVMSFTTGEKWTEEPDGYIYYAERLEPGETTEILFDAVHFAPKAGNEYQNCIANVVITAQAVQSANNGSTVMEAAGWPKTSGGSNV